MIYPKLLRRTAVALLPALLLAACLFYPQTPSPPEPARDPGEIELEPEVIQRSPASGAEQLAIRVLRLGTFEGEGNLEIEHRGEVQAKVNPNTGAFEGTGMGVGQAINDYSPYSYELCRYDMNFKVIGQIEPGTCHLAFTLYAEILEGGSCIHIDPNQSFPYPYGSWDTMVYVDEFIINDLSGGLSKQRVTDELVGKIHWINQVTVWKIAEIPGCEGTGGEPALPPPPEPWPTPTWQP